MILLVTYFEEKRPYWGQHLFQNFANVILQQKVENELCGQRGLGSGPGSTTYDLDDFGKMISFPQNSYEKLVITFSPLQKEIRSSTNIIHLVNISLFSLLLFQTK